MRKFYKKFYLIGLVFIISSLLFGCGADVSTTLSINDDMSGTRKMSIVVSKSDIERYFTGGIEKLDSLISSNQPQELNFSKSEDADNYIYDATLSFTSIEDYRSKVNRIRGQESSIVFSTPKSVFASGFALREDFTSLDLLDWLKEKIKEENLVNNTSDMWQNKSTKLYYSGQEYESSSQMDVNNIEYYPIERLILKTKLNYGNSYKRVISFIIPEEVYNLKSEEIKSYMESLVPEGADSKWEEVLFGEDNLNKEFSITFNADDFETLLKKTSKALDSNQCTGSFEYIEGDNPFNEYILFNENLDCSSFASDDLGRVNLEYTIEIIDSDLKIEKVNDKRQIENNNLYGDIVVSSQYNTKMLLKRENEIKKVDVKTKIKSDREVRKDIIFSFDKIIKNEFFEMINENFKEMGTETLRLEKKDDSFSGSILSLIFEGEIEQVNNDLQSIFGVGNQIGYLAEQVSISKIKTKFMEEISLRNFLKNTDYDSSISYSLRGTGTEFLNEVSVRNDKLLDQEEKKGFKIYSTEFERSIEVSYSGTRIILFGLMIKALVTIIISCIILIFIFKGLAKKDNLENANLIELFRHYGGKLFRYLKSGIQLITKPYLRKVVYKYFYGGIALKVLIVLCIATSLYWKLKKEVLIIWAIIFIIAIPAIWLKDDTEAIKAIDNYIKNDLEFFENYALQKLCLVKEQVNLCSALKVTGPYHKKYEQQVSGISKRFISKITFRWIIDLLRYIPRQIYKLGSDNKVRYSLVKASIFLYSEDQIYVYTINYDLCTGKIYEEESKEYFYKNVDCIVSGEKIEKIIDKDKVYNKRFEYFKIVMSSGESNYAIIDQDSGNLEEQITAMRNLIRDKKYI